MTERTERNLLPFASILSAQVNNTVLKVDAEKMLSDQDEVT